VYSSGIKYITKIKANRNSISVEHLYVSKNLQIRQTLYV